MEKNDTPSSWESKQVYDILQSNLIEQRRSRRWKIFFRLLLASYVAFFFGSAYMGSKEGPAVSEKHVAVVSVNGTIDQGSRTGASAESIIFGLKKAFEAKNAVAVILDINSPGGSPVQSARVYREIQRLQALHPERPVYAVAGDMAASGAYYIASAADYIYADANSLVGSVGVIMSGFGFPELLENVGVERRVYTAGESKSFMDPFSFENAKSVKHIQTLLDDIHVEFIESVRKGRGDRLKADNDELFSGLIWTGNQAIKFGLIDGLGSPREVALERHKTDKLVNYSHKLSALERLGNRLSAGFAESLVQSIGGSWKVQ